MPYMYDMPHGHENPQVYSESEIELLKLLNAGYQKPAESMPEYAPRFGQQADLVEEDRDEDFTVRHGYPRMSFTGPAYPPMPPDASSLPRPADDWFAEDALPAPQSYQTLPVAHDSDPYFGNSTFTQAEVTAAIDMEPYCPVDNYARIQQPPIWSPHHAWPAYSAAPLLHPRLVQLPDRPITPHDTYRYPSSHNEHIYIAPAAPSAETVNHAFAVWYSGQVISLLVTPGQYRPGVGGASDEVWGAGGREKEGWERVGRSAPDYSESWGRMGMASAPALASRKSNRRRPEFETRDPWNVEWANVIQPSPTLVNFVLDLVQRMSITPSALVAAVWFLTGLGLHEGDGAPGYQLRAFLREHRASDSEAVEKRVAALGLMLAGKWLDDNSFLIKSWHEVTTIPIKQLDRMERFALEDLHYSLFVPLPSWVDHVNKIYASLISKSLADEVDAVITPIIDQMVTEARENEVRGFGPVACSSDIERRLSLEELPAAADQAISRDWGSFARSYAHVGHRPAYDESGDLYPYYMDPMDEDEEMERAEKSVDALVNDMEEDAGVDEDEEEFLEYDGAKSWLPTAAENRRSASYSSDRSRSSPAEIDAYRPVPIYPSTVHNAAREQEIEVYEASARRRAVADWPSSHTKSSSTSDWLSGDSYGLSSSSKHHPSPCCQQCKTGDRVVKRHPLGDRSVNHRVDYNDEDAYLEPGISVVSPPTYYDMRFQTSSTRDHKRDRFTGHRYDTEDEIENDVTDEPFYSEPYTHASTFTDYYHHPEVTIAGHY